MLVATVRLGHREEPDVAARLADVDPPRVVLSDTDRRRSRVRTTTVDGREIGVVCGRDLDDGDVLETDDGTLVVVELEPVEALVLDVGGTDDGLAPAAALAVGHALGNRHWDLAVRGTEALFPVTTSRERMDDVVDDAVPETVPRRYETVSPGVFDDTPSGGATHGTDAVHAHTHGDGHEHSVGHSPEHDHSRERGRPDGRDAHARADHHADPPAPDGEDT